MSEDVFAIDFPDPPVPLWDGQAPEPDGIRAGHVPQLYPMPCAGGAPSSAIVVAPGGGYARKAFNHEGRQVGDWLNRNGIAAFILDYRVAPHRHPAPLADARRAVQLVRARAEVWNTDPGRVGILGFSAGGHLAAHAATCLIEGDAGSPDPVERESSRPDAAVLCYGALSFLPPHRHEGCVRTLLGENASMADARNASPESHVSEKTPPCFLWSSALDRSVLPENSIRFAQALAEAGVRYELHLFADGRHGIGLGQEFPACAQWPDLCIAWLRGLGF
jgi:acetyl esterase/lipase